MTRVLFFVPQYPDPVTGGLEKQARELARALTPLGVGVRVLSGRFDPGQPVNETKDGVVVRRAPWRGGLQRLLITAPCLALDLWRTRREFDLVHLHQNSWISLFVMMMARLLGRPVLIKRPSSGEGDLDPGGGLIRRLRRRLVLSADALVVMSAASLAELDAASYPRGRVLLTPNGIATPGRLVPKSRSGPCRVVFVGRLDPIKRLDLLLRAWAEIRAADADATLEIWGEGPLRAGLEGQAVDLGVADSVRFLGHVPDVTRRLAEADIFVLCSDTEGNSNAVLEAMAAGLPVVGTRVGGTPMQVGPDGAALLVAPGDVEGLADVLSKAIGDADFRQRTGEAMRRRIEAHFDIDRVAATYAGAYARLAEGRRDAVGELSDPVVIGWDAAPAAIGEGVRSCAV